MFWAAVVLLAVLLPQELSAATVPLPLTLPGQPGIQGELAGRGRTICYNLTFTDEAIRELVWWDKPRLILRMEPCVGKPHLQASVYGCPSDGARVVWDYMSEKMKGDLISQGKAVPAQWEWVGDTESLIIDITHRTYYVEVGHYDPQYPAVDGQDTFARFNLEAHVLDLARMPRESINPLKNACNWDRKIFVRARTLQERSVFGGFVATLDDDATKTEIEWNPPTTNLTIAEEDRCPWHANISGNFTYQVYVQEITDYVGTSGVDYDQNLAVGQIESYVYAGGDFVEIVKPPNCPPVNADGTGQCTSYTCRVCPTWYPECPKEFLTNCTEVAVDLEKVRTIVKDTSRPLESYMKNPERYTLWTSCGLQYTSNRVTGARKVEMRPPDRDGGWASIPLDLNPAGADGYWWTPEELMMNVSAGRLGIRLEGLKQDRNNVYLINIIVRDEQTGERAPYHMLTLQLKTAKFVPPKLDGPDVIFLSVLGAVLAALILAFAVVAYFVHRKRVKKRAQKKRVKK